MRAISLAFGGGPIAVTRLKKRFYEAKYKLLKVMV